MHPKSIEDIYKSTTGILRYFQKNMLDSPTLLSKFKITKYTLKKADIIHVQDSLMAKRVKEICHHNNIFIQPWGVDTNIFSKKNKDPNWAFNSPSILCSRREGPKYKLKTLIDAIPLILAKIDAKFILRTINAEMLSKIPKKNLLITGVLNQEDFKKAIASCTLFVDTFYPTDNKGGHAFGQALLEAMASETPTVIADRPTIHIKPKWYFGETYQPGNHNDLARVIIKLLKDKNKQLEIAKKNRESIEKL